MTNQPAKRRTSPLIVWPVCIVLMVVFYLASMGPVGWLWSRYWISSESYETVYFPLFWVQDHTDFLHENPIGRVYASYVGWFEKL